MKKLAILLVSIFIAFMPLFNINFSNIYAEEENNNSWTYIQSQISEADRNYTIAAIKAYLYLRGFGLNFTYNTQKAIVQFSYNHWDRMARDRGFTDGLAELNNKFAYAVDQNGFLKFYYTATALSTLNTLYQALLEYYNITENTNKNIYTGEWFEDDDGNGCYVFQSDGTNVVGKDLNTFNSHVTNIGTPYKYNGSQLVELLMPNLSTAYNTTSSQVIHYKNTSTNYVFKFQNVLNPEFTFVALGNSNYIDNAIYYNYPSYPRTFINGNLCISKANGNYYLANYLHISENNVDQYYFKNVVGLNSNIGAINAAISAAQAGMNAGIVAAGKAAAISTGKDGINALKDYLEDNDPNDTVAEPVDDPVNPPDVNPPKINIPVGIVNNMPINIQLPDLNDLIPDPIQQIPHGFTIPGLRYKFPFCIPFDMIAIYEVLDQTPQAPYFETEINFASFNYDLVIDLEEYDPYMVHIRNYFLILYIFGLLFITPKLLKA